MAKPGANKPKAETKARDPSPATGNKSKSHIYSKTIQAVRKESDNTEGPKKLSLFLNPIQTLSLFSIVFGRFLGRVLKHIGTNIILYALLAATIIVPHFVQGPHTPVF